jgi:hypothetical protein
MASSDATTFFEGFLPKVLAAAGQSATEIDGVILFKVVGKTDGRWTVDLRKNGTPGVHGGITAKPDLIFVLTEDFFGRFVSGRYDIEEAIRTEKLSFWGKPRVMSGFVEMLKNLPSPPMTSPGTLRKPRKGGVSLR